MFAHTLKLVHMAHLEHRPLLPLILALETSTHSPRVEHLVTLLVTIRSDQDSSMLLDTPLMGMSIMVPTTGILLMVHMVFHPIITEWLPTVDIKVVRGH